MMASVSYLYGVPNGVHQEWYPDGKKKQECLNLNGKPIGVWIEWYARGNKRMQYDFDKKIFKEWYENESLSKEFNYQERRAHYYSRKGKKETEIIFNNDSSCSRFITSNLSNGRFEGKEIGDGVRRDYFDNGRIARQSFFKNEKRDSTVEEWYYDGVKKLEGMYINGSTNGKFTEWYENGNIKRILFYKNGIPDGSANKWFKNGKEESEEFFVNGLQHGPACYWFENGSYKYVVRYENSRRMEWESWFPNGNKQEEMLYVMPIAW
jgi:antitoxin component YwqK of YwqJK toxin-antitoxin module